MIWFMSSVAFDTLKFVHRLRGAGFPEPQAEAVAAAFQDAQGESEMATKRDLAEMEGRLTAESAAYRAETKAEFVAVRAELSEMEGRLRAESAAFRAETKAEFAAIRAESKTEFAAIRAETKTEFAAVRAELRSETGKVEHRLELLEQRMTIRLGGMLLALAGIIIAAIRYLPPHP